MVLSRFLPLVKFLKFALAPVSVSVSSTQDLELKQLRAVKRGYTTTGSWMCHVLCV